MDASSIVAAHVRSLAESAPTPSRRAAPRASTVAPRTDAAVKFMTALYTAHWAEPPDLGGLPRAHRAREWLQAALDASPAIEPALRAYAAMRAVPAEVVLSAEHQRLHAALPEIERLTTYDEGLDPEVVQAIADVLAAQGRPLAPDVEERLIRHHGAAHGPVDLIHPRYHWRLLDRFDGEGGFGHRGGAAFYRARWPCSHFCLVADGVRGGRLQLTARVPRVESARTGEVGLEVNGEALGGAALTDRWRRSTFEIAAGCLHRGFNRITLRWPPLPAEGDAALAQIVARLAQGVPTDLHPVFGEVAVLRAT
jgi:hypothetical protein